MNLHYTAHLIFSKPTSRSGLLDGKEWVFESLNANMGQCSIRMTKLEQILTRAQNAQYFAQYIILHNKIERVGKILRYLRNKLIV